MHGCKMKNKNEYIYCVGGGWETKLPIFEGGMSVLGL